MLRFPGFWFYAEYLKNGVLEMWLRLESCPNMSKVLTSVSSTMEKKSRRANADAQALRGRRAGEKSIDFLKASQMILLC